MSGFYPPPDPYFEDVFNPNDYKTYAELARENDESIDLSNYVKKSGDVMNGYLSTPELATPKISFFDNTTQTTAFTTDMLNDVHDIQNTTNDITYDEETETTTINNTLKITNLKFGNSETQISPFTETHKSDINNSKSKVTNITYDSGLLKTTINDSCHINSLTCGNISTTHLTGTTSNLQNQINDLSTEANKIANLEDKTKHLSSDATATYNLSNNFFSYNMELGLTGSISFYPDMYAPDTFESQTFAFTDARKDKLENTTLINSSNKLDASLIADGTISNTEFQSLNNITGNIQTQLNGKLSNTTYDTTSIVLSDNILLGLPDILSTGSFYGSSAYTWRSDLFFDYPNPAFFDYATNTLKVGRYALSCYFMIGSLNQIIKMYSTVNVNNTAQTVTTIPQGYFYDTSYSTIQYAMYNCPTIYFEVTQPNVAYISIQTIYHFKANTGCKFQGQIIIQKY